MRWKAGLLRLWALSAILWVCALYVPDIVSYRERSLTDAWGIAYYPSAASAEAARADEPRLCHSYAPVLTNIDLAGHAFKELSAERLHACELKDNRHWSRWALDPETRDAALDDLEARLATIQARRWEALINKLTSSRHITLAFGPPVAILLLGVCINWVACGFRAGGGRAN